MPIHDDQSSHVPSADELQSQQKTTGNGHAREASPSLTPEQKIQRDKKITSLRASITNLESQTAQLESELAEIKSRLKRDPATTVQRHIRLLHEYNEIKDIGQGLMGIIADARGVRQIDVQREFGVGDGD